MKKNTVLLIALGLVGMGAAALIIGALYFVRPKDNLEVQLGQSERSPDGKWTAVVQMEVFNTALVVNDAVYAVRLKGVNQRDSAGDLVMNVQVNYPVPQPFVAWRDGKLVIVLEKKQNYQFFQSSVDGVAAVIERPPDSGGQDNTAP
jgi:hypothetical protein